MSDGSKIEWLARSGTRPATWNPVTGCTPISEGCTHCYAKRMSKRLRGRFGYPEAPHEFDVTLHPDKLGQPRHWRKPRTVFVCSMSDLFHDAIPFSYIRDIWNVMETADQHTYIVLTKRPDRMLEFLTTVDGRFAVRGYMRPLPNVWGLVTAENQKQLDARVPYLLQCPFVVRGVSIEPMLGPINLTQWLLDVQPGGWTPFGDDWMDADVQPLDLLHWIIVGGETGPGARPMHPDWARGVRDQCIAASVPFFFKKHGAYLHESQGGVSLPAHLWPDGTLSSKVDGKHSSYLLDGKEWHQWPS